MTIMVEYIEHSTFGDIKSFAIFESLVEFGRFFPKNKEDTYTITKIELS